MKGKLLITDDNSRLEKFLELLPETKIDSFLYDLSAAEYMKVNYGPMLYQYLEYRKTVLSKFLNPKIKIVYEKFNSAFLELYTFLIYNFFTYNSCPEMTGLYPEHRHSPDKEKDKFWWKKYHELENLYESFEKEYKNFLTTASEELNKKGMEEKGTLPIQKNGKPKFPHNLPAGTKWENITIKFEDDENVFIKVKQFKNSANFKDLGFTGKGNNPNPSEAWTFLRVLSMQKVIGELAINDKDAKDKYKKQKEFLAKGLQSYFSIDYDPFYPYRASNEKGGNSYRIKLTLIPPPEQTEGDGEGDKKDDVKEYLKEQTPQKYEE